MEMYEYERLRNEHVLRKAQELRKILESSGTSDSVVNERIIAQSCSSIIQDKIADRASGRPTGRRSSKPSTTAVRRSERNIAKDPVEYREEGEDEPHRRSQERSTTTKVCLRVQVIGAVDDFVFVVQSMKLVWRISKKRAAYGHLNLPAEFVIVQANVVDFCVVGLTEGRVIMGV
jgi:hypothetical protein